MHIWDSLIMVNYKRHKYFPCKSHQEIYNQESMGKEKNEHLKQLQKSVQNSECQVLCKLMKSRQIARKQKH